jgi:hypothetical protein
MRTLTFPQLQAKLKKLHKKKSLRKIAEEDYESKITHGTIDRCIKGTEPVREDIRKALGLSEWIIQEWARDEKGRRISIAKNEG